MKVIFKFIKSKTFIHYFLIILLTALAAGLGYYLFNIYTQNQILTTSEQNFKNKLSTIKQQLESLQTQDQVLINKKLTEEVKQINETYKNSIAAYEKLTDLKAQKQDTNKLDLLYTQAVKYLSEKNYSSASATLADLTKQLEQATPKIATPPQSQTTANAPQSNTPPNSGYSLQNVNVDGNSFKVAIIAADLNSTKVIIDTASDSDCKDNCPVKPLSEYVSRSGAFAGINGSYFCPTEYPNCVGKVGSFDTLVMNKNKTYFNSDNNVYSTVPAVIFSPGSARFVAQSLQWGRDTGVDGVIANYPLLVSSGNIIFSEAPNEPKFGGKAARTFIAAKDNNIYIGIVYNATMSDSAKVLKALGMNNALNLDQGGSTALWHGGKYLAGPGRNIPNAILFVKR